MGFLPVDAGIGLDAWSRIRDGYEMFRPLACGIQHLPLALGLGKHTFLTIKQNLFWAFIYNVVAIPVAAIGLLNPGVAALAMGFSDVVLAINSIRLKYKKVL